MCSTRNNPCLFCSANQSCCRQLSGLRISKKELEKYFRSHSNRFEINEYEETCVVSSSDNGPCPYWKESGCSIYAERPIDCRLYPYEIIHLKRKGNGVEVTVKENEGCPQRDCILMPLEEAETLIASFCEMIYGKNDRVKIRKVQANNALYHIRDFLGSLKKRLRLTLLRRAAKEKNTSGNQR